MKQRYKKTFKFNALHSTGGKSHPHTFTVTIYITSKEFVLFHKQEAMIESFFEKLRGKYLNALFNEKDMTLERLGEIIYLAIEDMTSQDLTLETVEIGDSPIRTIIFSDHYRIGAARLILLDKQ